MSALRSGATPTGLETRLRILEATDSIRWVIARYMELCDVPQPELDLNELGSLFIEDAIWEGIGSEYGDKFGRHCGQASIVNMLASFLPPSKHFAANAHVLSEGRINVTGDKADGAWIMQQLCRYEDGRQELLAARITAEFALDGALARISTFRTMRLFASPLAPLAVPAAAL